MLLAQPGQWVAATWRLPGGYFNLRCAVFLLCFQAVNVFQSFFWRFLARFDVFGHALRHFFARFELTRNQNSRF